MNFPNFSEKSDKLALKSAINVFVRHGRGGWQGMVARGLVNGGTAAVRHGGGIASQRLPCQPPPPDRRRSLRTVAGVTQPRRLATPYATESRKPSQVCAPLRHLQRWQD